jgi:hypothetical protein
MEQLQATTLKALLPHEGWSKYAGIVGLDILTDNLTRALYTHIEALHKAVPGQNLTLDMLKTDIEATYQQGESRREELLDTINALEYIPEADNNVTKETICKYASRQYCIKAAQYIATHLAEVDLDASIPAAYIEKAMDIGGKTHGRVAGLRESALPGETDDRQRVCPLGLAPELDAMLGGGIGSGELCVLLAPPKRGKTTYLCTIGARAAAKGRGVLHITLEMAEPRIRRRYESVWTNLEYHEMLAQPDVIETARDRVLNAGGDVYIEDWNHARDKTPQDIKSLVSQMRSDGQRIDVVIVDYLALLLTTWRYYSQI